MECAKLRPRIAEIPVGAVDADRGIVESPFELYFFPWYSNSDPSNDRANVTPLTSLFTSYLTNELDKGLEANIDVADGCGEVANTIGIAIESLVEEVMGSLAVLGLNQIIFMTILLLAMMTSFKLLARQLQIIFSLLTESLYFLNKSMVCK